MPLKDISDQMTQGEDQVTGANEQPSRFALPADQQELVGKAITDSKEIPEGTMQDVSGFVPGGVDPLVEEQQAMQMIEEDPVAAEMLMDEQITGGPVAELEAAPQPVDEVAEIQQAVQQEKAAVKQAVAPVAAAAELDHEVETRIADIDRTIDPNRIYKNASTGQKIMMSIGLILSGIGTGLAGGEDIAAKMLFKAIDNDIMAQKLDIENALAKRAAALEKAKIEVARQAERQKSQTSQLQAMKLIAEIDKLQAETAGKRREIALGGMGKLGAEDKKRLDMTQDGLVALVGMRQALETGQNTFSVVGDNDYTMQNRLLSEAIGRMQSGGAIKDEEAARFMDMAPTATDSKDIQLKKLDTMTAWLERKQAKFGAAGQIDVTAEAAKGGVAMSDQDSFRVKKLMDRGFSRQQATEFVLKLKQGRK